jgi:nitrite reductase/ring-hydroxylating ferredoxin subunit
MWVSLCPLEELHEGRGRYVELGRYQLAVFLSGGKPFVMDNYCPHAGGNLAGGVVEEGCAICPWHDWAFRLDNGQLKEAAHVAVSVYPCRILERPGLPALVQAELEVE